MSDLRALKAVYCYYLTETRPLLRAVAAALPDSLWRITARPGDVRPHLDPLFDPPLVLPVTAQGRLDLDEIHRPIIERIVAAYAKAAPGLESFDHAYPTAGSSEGIFHTLAKFKTAGQDSIYLLAGEYEGYAEYAGHLGMAVRWIDPAAQDPRTLAPGRWFISNPSARDGNIIGNEFIRGLCDAGHRVALDLSYVGSTADHPFETDHPNVDTVFLSFSKPYGVFRFRIGGFLFSRSQTPSLYGTKWFKDTTRLLQALKLAEALGPHAIHGRYAATQSSIVDAVNRQFGLPLAASDSFLLAHVTDAAAATLAKEQRDLLEPYRRGRGYRLCLTPYFEEREAAGNAAAPQPRS